MKGIKREKDFQSFFRLKSFSTQNILSYRLNILTNIMITYFSPKFNKIKEIIKENFLKNNINIYDCETVIPDNIILSAEKYISSLLVSVYQFVSVPCPKCGKKHLIPMPSSYQRNIIFKIENIFLKFKICVPRLKCSNCGSTHAVLPSFCVPFKQYSKQAILEIAIQATESSTETVSESLNLESKQIRRFVNIVKHSINNIKQLSKIYPAEFKNNTTIDFNLNTIIQELPKNFDELYFKEFRVIFLYKKIKRKIYMEFKKLSI